MSPGSTTERSRSTFTSPRPNVLCPTRLPAGRWRARSPLTYLRASPSSADAAGSRTSRRTLRRVFFRRTEPSASLADDGRRLVLEKAAVSSGFLDGASRTRTGDLLGAMLARCSGSHGQLESLRRFWPVSSGSIGQCWSERSDHFPTTRRWSRTLERLVLPRCARDAPRIIAAQGCDHSDDHGECGDAAERGGSGHSVRLGLLVHLEGAA